MSQPNPLPGEASNARLTRQHAPECEDGSRVKARAWWGGMGGEGWVWKGRLKGMGALRFSCAPVQFGGAELFCSLQGRCGWGWGSSRSMRGMTEGMQPGWTKVCPTVGQALSATGRFEPGVD